MEEVFGTERFGVMELADWPKLGDLDFEMNSDLDCFVHTCLYKDYKQVGSLLDFDFSSSFHHVFEDWVGQMVDNCVEPSEIYLKVY